MFLKFVLVEEVRPYHQVDVTKIISEKNMYWEFIREINWEMWERKTMELTESTYHDCHEVFITREVLLGGRDRAYNKF